ncbi:MAG TPA: response regulator transcription factor [Candidatus Onthousia excrementipullorum]|uniref:Response regulator transcription factor n=1 Tax=Candidatus Onthousia excrementipullorum TaxID=2840884 RepID=A0A9D1DTJ0_9FIRM|nr:response regulator transcription factor [Candidatus Onthousia excrementipullorum]
MTLQKVKILIVDDEKNIREVIREYASLDGYDVMEAASGVKALELLNNNKFDLMILDIMMPIMDGFTLLNSIPKEKKIPTIILSARDDEVDKLEGFDRGIDDYLCKPFSPRELMARVKAILKRTKGDVDSYSYDKLVVNFLEHTIRIDDKEVNVTPKEFEILKYFINNKRIAISREQLLNKIWGYDFYGDDRTVDTHIKMLRNNLGRYRDLIITVRGIGYKFDDEK